VVFLRLAMRHWLFEERLLLIEKRECLSSKNGRSCCLGFLILSLLKKMKECCREVYREKKVRSRGCMPFVCLCFGFGEGKKRELLNLTSSSTNDILGVAATFSIYLLSCFNKFIAVL